VCICNESSYNIHQEVSWTSMPCMLNLRDILQLVMNSLNDGSFSHHQLVKQRHKSVLHVPLDPGNQLDSLTKQEIKQILRDVSLVTKELTEYVFDHIRHRFSIIHIAWCEAKGKEFSLVIDNEMKLKAIEPSHCVLATLSHVREDSMRANPTVMADNYGHRINEGDTTAVPLSGHEITA